MSPKHDQDAIPDGQATDNTYVSHGTSHIPVQKDEAPVDDPIDPATADTDEQLGKSSLLLPPSSPFSLPSPPPSPTVPAMNTSAERKMDSHATQRNRKRRRRSN